MICPHCSSTLNRKRGFLSNGNQRYMCKSCGKSYTDATIIKDKLEVSCPYCDSTNIKKGGHLSSGKQRYLCKDCKKHFCEDTIVQQPISFTISCPDCNSQDLRRCGKTPHGVQRYLCKGCGRKFVEEVMVRPASSHQVVCPRCGHTYAKKAGHTGSGNQYWKCLSCEHKFLENPRYKHLTAENIKLVVSLLATGATPREIGERVGKTGRTIKNVLEEINPKLKEFAVLNISRKREEKKEKRLRALEEKAALKEQARKEELKVLKEQAISLYNIEGLTQRQVSRKLHISETLCNSFLSGILSKVAQVRSNMIKEVMKGKNPKKVAEKYNYNYYNLNKLLKPYYAKEVITKEQEAMVVKYGVFLKVPVDYLAEYIPCSEHKCMLILKKYKEKANV